MKPRAPGYHIGALAMVLNTGLSAASGIAALWLLNRILTKEQFGSYSVAMNAVYLAAIVATMGLDRAILLRISGLGGVPGVLRGSGLALRAGLAVGCAACVVAGALAFGAAPLVQAGAAADLAFWLPALAVAVIPLALTGLVQGWFQANHRASSSVLLPGLSDISRAALIGLVLAASGGAAGVAGSVILAASLPLAVAAVWTFRAPRRRLPRRLRLADFRGGAFFLLQNLTNTGMRYADLLLLGLLATGSATADYAVAARLAAAADLGRIALKPTFTPRVRLHLRNEEEDRLGREYHALRLGGLIFALAAAAAFAVWGHPILQFFGPFQSAYGPLLVLAAVHVVTAGCGMHSSYLAMSGEVVWSAALRVGSLAALVLLFMVVVPSFGALGAAFAMLAVQCAVNALSVLLLRRLRRFVAVPAIPAMILACAIAVLSAGAAGALAPGPTGFALAMLAAAATLVEPSAARDLVRLLRRPADKTP